MRNLTISVNPYLNFFEKGIPREAFGRFMANRNIYNAMRKSVHLTDYQRAILVGTLLGDGSLIETSSKNNLRLQITHCDAQKAFVFWKYEAFKSLVLTPPTYQKQNDAWRFRTISHPELTEKCLTLKILPDIETIMDGGCTFKFLQQKSFVKLLNLLC